LSYGPVASWIIPAGKRQDFGSRDSCGVSAGS